MIDCHPTPQIQTACSEPLRRREIMMRGYHKESWGERGEAETHRHSAYTKACLLWQEWKERTHRENASFQIFFRYCFPGKEWNPFLSVTAGCSLPLSRRIGGRSATSPDALASATNRACIVKPFPATARKYSTGLLPALFFFFFPLFALSGSLKLPLASSSSFLHPFVLEECLGWSAWRWHQARNWIKDSGGPSLIIIIHWD